MKHYVEVLICSVLLAALLVFCMVMWNDTHADEYLPLDSISPVIKPDLKPLECGLQRETPESAYMGMRLASNGMEFHFYDTNGDGIRIVDCVINDCDKRKEGKL